MKTKIRQHNEFFQPLSKISKCPSCGTKKQQLYAWGEYSRGKWHTVKHFCENCFQDNVVTQLKQHKNPCGCQINLVPRSGYSLPDFIAKEQI